jgi:hypothetical protein
VTPGWDALAAAITDVRALIADAAPDTDVAAEGEAYVTRVVASALGGAVLGHLLREDGLLRPLPCYGGPNPHYQMRHAPVDPSGRYRLEGKLNGSERVGIGLYSFLENGVPIEKGYAAFDQSNCGPDGTFALDISADVQGPGTLAIDPAARVVLVRILHRDPDCEPARLRFNGGPPARDLALVTGTNDGALGFVARSLRNNVREYLKWTAAVRTHPNRFEAAPPELAETVQGDPDTQYFLGSFDLGDGEWLEVTMPADIGGYWSVHVYNFWFEHLQTPGADDRSMRADLDGRIRIAIGPNTPGEQLNRVDTLGRRRGSLICRIIGSGGCPSAVVRTA